MEKPIHKILILQIIIGFFYTIEISAQDNFTIEQVLSSSFPSDLATSSSENYAAWVENTKGVKNIFISKDAKTSRQITSYTKDDGQFISSLIFSVDNKFLFFVKGNSFSQMQEIYKIDLKTGIQNLVSEGSSPVLSHGGKTLAFISQGQVMKSDLTNQKSPELFFTDRGRIASLTWSPDDSKIAFVSYRHKYSFVGTYDIGLKKVTYISPSVDKDLYFVWSFDSKHIAYIKKPFESNVLLFISKKTALPWSICIGNSQTGTSKEIWKATEGSGSVFQAINAESQLFWTKNGHLIFPWEKSGWINLYSIKTDGSDLKNLTKGNGEVKFASISKDKKSIVYSSNQDDIDRHHIWEINTSDGQSKQLSKGDGLEWSPKLSGSGNKLYLLASGATQPLFPAILENRTIVSLKSNNPEFPENKLVKPKQVIITATDGMKINGQLFFPPNMEKGKKYPSVIFTHGGPQRQMYLGFHYKDYYHHTYAFNQYLANHGYIVLSINYRSGTGYGLEFREAESYGADGASEFQDLVGAGNYLKKRADVDANRIGLWGGSYGGYLTAMGLAKASNLFAAGVDIHGVHNWYVTIKNFIPDYNPLESSKIAKLAYKSSPIAYVKDWKSPVLLIHGDNDHNVPFSETMTLVETLRKNNVEFEQLIFPDEAHEFLLYSTWLKAFTATFDFFERKLKNKKLNQKNIIHFKQYQQI